MSLISQNQYNNDFIEGKILGKGNCATVVIASNIKTGKQYAVKKTKLTQMPDCGQCMSQLEIIRSMNDQAIPQLFFYYFRECKSSQSFQMGMIMELCQKSLQQEIKEISEKKIRCYEEEQMWDFTKQMVRFFAKMQRMKYLHRDIKPGNIMIKFNGQQKKYKVIDFGYALKMSQYANESITGTAEYASPKVKEKFDNHSLLIAGINVKDDVFSLGKTILEMIRVKVTKNENIKQRYFTSMQGIYGSNLPYILRKMLNFHEQSRWDFIQLQQEIKRIELMKKTNFISLDDSMIQEKDQEINEQISQQNSQSYSKTFNIKSKYPISRHIEIQTEAVHVDEFLKYIGNLNKKGILNIAETKYIQNKRNQFSETKIESKMILSKCNFDRDIYSMMVFDDFILLGMTNRIGVIPLKSKSQNLYIIKPNMLNVSHTHFSITKIKIFAEKIIFIGTSQMFLFCQALDFINQINSIFDNHKQLVNKKQLKFIPKNLTGKPSNTREPKIYEKDLGNFSSGYSHSQVSCMELIATQFCGSFNQVFIGHWDGKISIFGGDVVYKDNQAIMDIQSIGSNKLVYTTFGGWIRMLVFKQQPLKYPIEMNKYEFFTQDKIKYFKLLDNHQKQARDGEIDPEKPFVEIYISNGQQILLNSQLEKIRTQTLIRRMEINKVCQTQWKWTVKKLNYEQNQTLIAQRKTKNNPLNSYEKEKYLITDEGKLFCQRDKKLVYQFDLNQPCDFHIQGNLIVAANYDGNVKVLNTEPLFKNIFEAKEKSKKELPPKAFPNIDKSSNQINQIQKSHALYETKDSQHLYPVLNSASSTKYPSYSHALMAKLNSKKKTQ